MACFRRIWRIFLLLLFMPPLALLGCIGKNRSWGSKKFSAALTRIWAVITCRCIGYRVNVYGEVPDFKGGIVLPTHLGGMDILAHATLKPIRFASMVEVKYWGVAGWFLGLNQPIWIDRHDPQKSRRVLEEFVDTLQNDVPLLVYPEGRASNGLERVLPFKYTAFEAAVETSKPVLPVITFFRPADNNWNFAWSDNLKFSENAWRVLGCKNLICDLYVLPAMTPEAGMNRKTFGSMVYRKVAEEHGKLSGKYRKMYGLEQEVENCTGQRPLEKII